MDKRTKVRSEERVRIAREYLRLAQNDLETARHTRLHYAKLGREYGVTWAELADALDLSVSAARMMIHRDGKGDQ